MLYWSHQYEELEIEISWDFGESFPSNEYHSIILRVYSHQLIIYIFPVIYLLSKPNPLLFHRSKDGIRWSKQRPINCRSHILDK